MHSVIEEIKQKQQERNKKVDDDSVPVILEDEEPIDPNSSTM